MAEHAVLEVAPNYQAANIVRRTEEDAEIRDRDVAAADRNSPFGSSRSSIKCIVWLMRIIFFTLVTGCLVLSKLTIIEKFARINQLVNINRSASSNSPTSHPKAATNELHQTVNLYWQLLFIIMIPSILTWLYSIFKGILSNSVNHPWPKKSAIALCIIMACFEGGAEVILYFIVFTALPPLVVIFVMTGLFSVQGILNVYSVLKLSINPRSKYEHIGSAAHNYYHMSFLKKILLIFIFMIGIIFQVTGIASVTGFIVMEASDTTYVVGILLVLCLGIISCTWTNTLQKLTCIPSVSSQKKAVICNASQNLEMKTISGRWKSGFIATTTRLVLYPLLSYLFVRLFYTLKSDEHIVIDPWCIPNITELSIDEAFSWSYHDSTVFGVHIVSSFIANIVQGVACYMTLHVSGLALPVFFATPISILVYFMSNSDFEIKRHVNFYMFPFVSTDRNTLDWSDTLISHWYYLMFGLAIVIWIGQILISEYNLIKSRNVILSPIENMFVRPYYNSVLLEQYLAINRCVTANSSIGNATITNTRNDSRMVFMCSTMYRENATEMRQLLRSIHRVARYNIHNNDQNIKFESHIFFDGGCHGNELSQFAIQLMSLIPDALKVNLKDGIKIQTPYGYRFSWVIESTQMPFMIHLKDNQKIKNKKRWSQVMYMNYILKYRAETDKLDLSNTYILTTDADIDFKAEAVVVLLDMLARDNAVGAVCARTFPLGFGLLYWYQVFDYAVGHWLQKSAEHILGSVLCCPGCFSMFRCTALQDCVKMYSTDVEDALEFLMKDMGEDRWLCTLLVEKGWRLEYCAISKNYTYCPVEFDEFFKQRRRWIPSTIANLWLLVSQGKKMTSNNESIGWLFIIYQVFIILSTTIAPATVILIISSGLQSSFSVNSIAVIVIFIVLTVGYGLVCLYTSQQTQLDIAKLLTFLFAIVMATVIVGIFKEILKDIIQNIEDSEGLNATFSQSSVPIPIGESTVYVALFASVFVVTAILHYNEFLSLFHCLWYLLGLPAGYLLLLVYSTANLNSRSWGTREKQSNDTQGIFLLVWGKLKSVFSRCLVRVGIMEDKKEHNGGPGGGGGGGGDEPARKEKGLRGTTGLEDDMLPSTRDEVKRNYTWLRGWLRKYDCESFYDCFVNEGYTEEWYLAGMSEQDLRDIGIRPEGYVRHLMKGIKRLAVTPMQIGIPKDVESWINELHMAGEDEYIMKFCKAGYFGPDDVEHLNRITKEELINDIGVYKKAHVKRFLQALKNLKYRSQEEEQMIEAQDTLQLTNDRQPINLDDDEIAFWFQQLDLVLYPMPESLSKTNDLKDSLRFLRNSVLMAVLFINLIWIILLYLLTISELKGLGLDTKFLSLAFLVVYGLILSIQFIAMLFHRIVTLSHYISRLNQSLPVEQTFELTETTK